MSEYQPDYAGVGTANLSSDLEKLADDSPFTIHGVAIAPGDVTRGQSGDTKLWTAEGLEAAAATLEGQPLVKDHINTTDGKVGNVTKADYAPGVGVVYEADIAPHYEELAQDVAAGMMEVSVRALHPETESLERTDDGIYVVEELVFDNLSLVTTGASPSNTADIGSISEFESDPISLAASPEGAETSWSTATLSRPAGQEPVEADATDEEVEDSVEAEELDNTVEPTIPTRTVATVQRRPDNGSPSSGTDQEQLNYAISTMYEINYDSVDEEELEELTAPVVVEEEELEALREDAEAADTVQEELSELRDDFGELSEARETLAEISEEHIAELRETDDPVIVSEAELEAKDELVDETGSIYAEELANHTAFSAEELQDRFTPVELADKVEETEDASIAEELAETEPEPEGGSVEDEELEEEAGTDEEAEELEAKVEGFAQTLEAQGWETQAEQLREGEIALDDIEA